VHERTASAAFDANDPLLTFRSPQTMHCDRLTGLAAG
jgi:hypothetical protein